MQQNKLHCTVQTLRPHGTISKLRIICIIFPVAVYNQLSSFAELIYNLYTNLIFLYSKYPIFCVQIQQHNSYHTGNSPSATKTSVINFYRKIISVDRETNEIHCVEQCYIRWCT